MEVEFREEREEDSNGVSNEGATIALNSQVIQYALELPAIVDGNDDGRIAKHAEVQERRVPA